MADDTNQNKGMSRREFVVAAGATAVVAGTAGALISGCATVPQKKEQPALQVTPEYIVVDLSLCSGCRICEQVCSEYHYGVYNPGLTAIVVERDYGGGGHWIATNTCRQCPNPWCMRSCPVDAIWRDIKTGAVVIDEKTCIGCEDCVKACPFGMAFMRPDGKKAFKCDMCGGDPQCVANCPMNALSAKPLMCKDTGSEQGKK